MSDTSPRDQAALLFNAKQAAVPTPRPGEEVWRLRNAEGRVQSCELRDNTQAGAGWDVMLSKRRTAVLAPLRQQSPRALRRREHKARCAQNRVDGPKGLRTMNAEAFTVADLPPVGFLNRLRGRLPREVVFVKIRNLLATTPFEQITRPDIVDALASGRLELPEVSDELDGLFEQAVHIATADGTVTETERRGLTALQVPSTWRGPCSDGPRYGARRHLCGASPLYVGGRRLHQGRAGQM